MAFAAPSTCPEPGCATLVPPGQRACPVHKSERTAQSNRRRRSDPDKVSRDSFYTTARWIKLRKWFIVRNPLCTHCERDGLVTEAKHVDHIVEREDDPSLEYSESNLQSLCVSCHSKKSAATRKSRRITAIF